MNSVQITVKYRGDLRDLTKITNEKINALSIGKVLKHIREQFGDEALKKARSMLIVVNGESILLLNHFRTVLKDGDEVCFLPICGGG